MYKCMLHTSHSKFLKNVRYLIVAPLLLAAQILGATPTFCECRNSHMFISMPALIIIKVVFVPEQYKPVILLQENEKEIVK